MAIQLSTRLSSGMHQDSHPVKLKSQVPSPTALVPFGRPIIRWFQLPTRIVQRQLLDRSRQRLLRVQVIRTIKVKTKPAGVSRDRCPMVTLKGYSISMLDITRFLVTIHPRPNHQHFHRRTHISYLQTIFQLRLQRPAQVLSIHLQRHSISRPTRRTNRLHGQLILSLLPYLALTSLIQMHIHTPTGTASHPHLRNRTNKHQRLVRSTRSHQLITPTFHIRENFLIKGRRKSLKRLILC